MRRTTAFLLAAGAGITVALGLAVPDWHRPVPGTQVGADGAGRVTFAATSPWQVTAAPASPEPPAEGGGAKATDTYRNVSVLTDLSAPEFMRLQRAMTAWVSPSQGCAFCHTGEDYAAETPMKGATRDMLRLTRHLNTAWRDHFGEAGVTCFSCHRGQPVPPETWFPRDAPSPRPATARSENWDETADTVRKFFPDNGWSLYLLQDQPIRAESATALRSDTVAPAVEAKRVYEMMMQMSDGIGVNCGHCHESRSFSDWSQSPHARWVAYDAIRMLRDVNRSYLAPLAKALPQSRELAHANDLALPPRARGPQAGGGLAVCATCHYGRLAPDAGAATVANYPGLAGVGGSPPAAPTR